MKNCFCLATLASAFAIVTTPLVLAAQQTPAMGHAAELVVKTLPPTARTGLTVTSPSFKEGADIPYEYTQYRGNIFPGLSWTAGPAGTQSYAIIVQGENLSRTGGTTSIHLTLFNVPEKVTTLQTGMDTPPAGAIYGPNVHGPNHPYAGPHTHTAAKNEYHYQVFALDTMLPLKPDVEFDALVTSMNGHVLASGDLIGLSAKDPNATEPVAVGTNSIRR
jgi:para-nitrobenzyl esterase